MGLYRFTGRRTREDGTQRVKVRTATAEQPELWLHFDPDQLLEAVELTDEEAARVSRHVELTLIEDKKDAEGTSGVVDPGAGGDPADQTEGGRVVYTRESLEEKNLDPDLRDIAKELGLTVSGTRKDNYIDAILASQDQ